MRTFVYFIKNTGLKASARFTHSVRKGDPDFDGWEFDAWKVTMRLSGKTMAVSYKMGTGHAGHAPKLEDVLYSLTSDAIEFFAPKPPTFEEWADAIGYATDSRKAEKVYRACKRQYARLSEFLGAEHLLTLVCCEEEG